jgi:hypothetical protein
MGLNHSPSIVTSGLVLALDAANPKSYPGSGTTWNDLNGNINNGTLVNTPTYNTNVSFSFDYTQFEYVTFANTNSLMFLNLLPYTLEAWIYPTIDPGSGNYTGIFNRESSDVGAVRDGYNVFVVQSGGSNVLISSERFAAGSVVNAGEYLATASFLNNWHHILATFDGSTVKFYRNASLKQTSGITTTNLTNNIQTLQIAQRGGQYYRGNISIANIYNRALTADEILQNYNALKGRYGL